MKQSTNIRLLLDKITRHPLLREIPFETAIDYTIDFLRIVGCPDMFEEKCATLEVKQYRALLPCDFYSEIQLRKKNGDIFRYTTDSFHMSECKDDNFKDLTYKIQGNVIFTSIKEGCIELAYNAISVDEEGYPLIPDNSEFTRALSAYIKKEWFSIQFDLGKITPAVLQMAQQDYAWAVGACQSEFNRLSIDEMEALTNSWNTLIVRANEHRTGFKYNGTKEYWRNH